MSASRVLRALLVFLCVATLEVGWVVCVRLVTAGETWKVAGWAMTMQGIAYLGLLPVVKDRWLALAGVIGAGVGAVAGMLLVPALS